MAAPGLAMHALLLSFLIVASWYPVLGWRSCGVDDGGGFCPDANTCCATNVTGSSCITEARDGTSNCCTDDGTGLTGCRPGYKCVSEYYTKQGSQQKRFYCELQSRKKKKKDDRPLRLPRYQLCSMLDPDMRVLHSLRIKPHAPGLAYYSNYGAIDDPSTHGRSLKSSVKQVLIMIHGSGRNAQDYFCCGLSSLPRQIMQGSIMVIAPWFLSEDDDDETTGPSSLRWNETGPIPHTWRYGADSIVGGGISSYTAMDVMVERLIHDKATFPNLERIIVAGHSAGGQFTHRWALMSDSPVWWSPHRHSVRIRVVAANPRSFCYLDARRYVNETLRIPDQSLIDRCPGYNSWEWGLERGGRLPTPYIERIRAKRGIRRILGQYPHRDVVYLAGELDVLSVEAECEDDDFQGPNRRERSRRFFASLEKVYNGRNIHRRVVADDVPHDHCLIFQSPAGQSAMFDDDIDDDLIKLSLF